MKRILLVSVVFISLFFAHEIHGQDLNFEQYWQSNQSIKKTGMMVLGGWAIGNMAVGLYGRNQNIGSQKYFHEMNFFWNTVNLAIAGFGYYSAFQADLPEGSYLLAKEHFDFQKVLLFNAGLDIGYMAAGAWMIARAQQVENNADRWRGYGQSVILQGAFLFAFDLTMVLIHQSTNPQLQQLLSQIQVSGNSLTFTF